MVTKRISKRPLTREEAALLEWMKRAIKWAGYTQDEMADRLKMNRNSFKSRLSRGVRIAETFVLVCFNLQRIPTLEELETFLKEQSPKNP